MIERLRVEDVLSINEDLCADSGENSVCLDREGLEAAVGRPWAGISDVEFYPRLVDKAAALLHEIASRQLFENGNKRTAWTAAAAFLDVNGVDVGAVEPVQSDMFVRAVALDHTLDISDMAEWFEVAARQHAKPAATGWGTKGRKRLKGGEVLIAELLERKQIRPDDLSRHDPVIRDTEFENVLIIGPAILFPVKDGEVVFDRCSWDVGHGGIEAILWDIDLTTKPKAVGVVGLHNCIFRDCQFFDIGMAMGPDGVSNLLHNISV